MGNLPNDTARLLEAAAEARQRDDEREKRLERVEDLLKTLLIRHSPVIDPQRLADRIVNTIISAWQRSGFKDPWNFLTTSGRDVVREEIEEFFRIPH